MFKVLLARQLILFSFLLAHISVSAQLGGRFLIYGQPKFMLSVSSGLDVVNNDNLNNWLSRGGANVSDQVALNYLVKGLYSFSGRSVIGAEFKIIRTKHPIKSDELVVLSYGRVYKLGGIFLIPLIGVGMNSETIDLGFTVPSSLVQLNMPGAQLHEKELVLMPSIMIHKHVARSFAGFGLELGCRIYQSQKHVDL